MQAGPVPHHFWMGPAYFLPRHSCITLGKMPGHQQEERASQKLDVTYTATSQNGFTVHLRSLPTMNARAMNTNQPARIALESHCPYVISYNTPSFTRPKRQLHHSTRPISASA